MDGKELMQYPVAIRRAVLEAQALLSVVQQENEALHIELAVHKEAGLLLAEELNETGHCPCSKGWINTHCVDDGNCTDCIAQWAVSEARSTTPPINGGDHDLAS